MVSVNILFIKLRDSRVNTFCLWKSKAPSFSTSFPPLTQSLHQKCELLLLCTEHCIHTHTHTHTHQLPSGSGPSTQHRFHAGSSSMLSPGQWPQQSSTEVVITELKAREKQPKCPILRRFSPSPWVEPDSRWGRRRQLGLVERTCVCVRSLMSDSGTP